MSNKSNKASIKTKIQNSISKNSSKSNKFVTDDLFSKIENEIQFNKEEKLVLIEAGIRNFIGRVKRQKSKYDWKSPSIKGLGLNDVVEIFARDDEGQVVKLGIHPENITIEIIEAHETIIQEKSAEISKNKKPVKSVTIDEKLAILRDRLSTKGWPSDKPAGLFDGEW